MKLTEVINILNGKIICGAEYCSNEVSKAIASDLMSDVLTLNEHNLLLLTGLNNLQTIRTAEMAEIRYIVFVRNKMPSPQMIELASEEGIVLILSNKSMYAASGKLFEAGLQPVY